MVLPVSLYSVLIFPILTLNRSLRWYIYSAVSDIDLKKRLKSCVTYFNALWSTFKEIQQLCMTDECSVWSANSFITIFLLSNLLICVYNKEAPP
jgi:hypothetical protein